MSAPPIPCTWTGEAFQPQPRFAKMADEHFVIGQAYRMAPVEDRSRASHGHYFAMINEAWANLPEALIDQYPNPEALRKKALIKAGYRDERSIVAASKAEAQRVAAFVRPMDDTAVVVVHEAVVLVLTAKSQSLRAMGKADFQASKDAVLAVLADLIGVAPAELSKAQAA
jgi:hypothetical protein